MGLEQRIHETDGTLGSFVTAAIPGDSSAISALRAQIVALCEDPLARGALLLGPPGSGKSVLARVIAIGRYLTLVKPETARAFLEGVRADGPGRLSLRGIPWLVEQSLPGLVGTLADSQLFGHERGAFSEAKRRKYGVFELAAVGKKAECLPIEGDLASPESRGTFGVVLLDEIGDLDQALQPKLLTVLAGGEVYRVGSEGSGGYRFLGLTLGATWRDVSDDSVLRSDLRDRLSDHVIRVPSLSERSADLELIIRSILEDLKSQVVEWGDQLRKAPVDGIDRPRVDGLKERVRHFELTSADLELLVRHDWARCGELRGLVQVLKRALVGVADLRTALASTIATSSAKRSAADSFFELMLEMAPVSDQTAAAQATQAYYEIRSTLADRLQADERLLERLASHLGVSAHVIRRRLSDLKRGGSSRPALRRARG